MRNAAALHLCLNHIASSSRQNIKTALLCQASQLDFCSSWPAAHTTQCFRVAAITSAAAPLATWSKAAGSCTVLGINRFGAINGHHVLQNLAVSQTLGHRNFATDPSAQQQSEPSVKPSTNTQNESASQPAQPAQKPSATTQTRIVLYKGAFMRPFRLLVRFKIFQLVGIASLAIPINTFLVEGSVEGVQMVMATALVIGCAAASSALWYYSRRYVGELSLLPEKHQACFSVLDFWGNREDTFVDIRRILPPLKDVSQAARTEMAELPLIPIDVEADRQYLVSLRHGIFVDRAKLFQLLEGQQMEPVGVSP